MSERTGYSVRIPADVERPDQVLGRLTARQVAILAATGLALWVGFSAGHAALPRVPVLVLLAPCAPVAVLAIALALGKRDGLSADRFALAALKFARAPRRLVAAEDGTVPGAPGFLPTALARAAGPAPAPLVFPAAGIDPDALVHLRGEGAAGLAACGAVNFALRTAEEQEALVAVFARFLNSLTAPVQILVRSHRLDVSGAIDAIENAAPALAHPALEQAALEHAGFLRELSSRRSLLARQVLLAVREPRADGRDAAARIERRLDEAARTLTGAGISVRAFDQAGVHALFADHDEHGAP